MPDGFPERFWIHGCGRTLGDVEQRRVVAGAMADVTLRVAVKVEAEEESATECELRARHRRSVVEQQRLSVVKCPDIAVGQ